MKYGKTMFIVFIIMGAISFMQVYAFESGLWPGEGRPVLIAGVNMNPRERPAKDSRIIKKMKIRKGQKIDFKETRYRTIKSGLITVVAPSLVSVTSFGKSDFLSRDDYYNKGTEKSIELKSGDSLEFLQYRAEGDCLIKMSGEVLALPPVPNTKIASEPLTEWWVLAVDKQKNPIGWVLIDEETIEFAEREF